MRLRVAALAWAGAAALCGMAAHAAPVPARVPASPPAPAMERQDAALSDDARLMQQWIVSTGDHRGRPFALVDKRGATLYLFDGAGRLQAASAVLLGQQPGDHAVPGVGAKPLSQILPSERTTPAGRYASEPGRNLQGEDIVWFDYDAGLAIHRLRPGASEQLRRRKLASADPAQRRASLGCVVVPVAFYDTQVAPVLGRQRGTVYVLPETRPVQAVFGGMQVGLQAEGSSTLR